VSNGTGAGVNGIADSTGAAFQTTSAQLTFGYFLGVTDGEIATMTAPSLLTAFQAWGPAGANFTAAGPLGARGYASYAAPARAVTGSSFDNMNMYVLVGNAADYRAASEFLILKTSFVFAAADDAVATPILKTFTSANSQVLLGGTLADLKTTNSDSSANPGWTTAVPVPETSTALLGALGALGLLRRRR
jgi:hypothetical protein